MKVKRITLLSIIILFLSLSIITSRAVGQAVITKKFFSEELKQGDLFTWQIVHFTVDGETVTTGDITENKIIEGSIKEGDHIRLDVQDGEIVFH